MRLLIFLVFGHSGLACNGRMFIKKGKFLKVLRHFIYVLQYYPKLNNGQHIKPSN